MMTSQAHFQSMSINALSTTTTAQQLQTPHSTMSDIDYVIAYICNDAANEALPVSEFDTTMTSEIEAGITAIEGMKIMCRTDSLSSQRLQDFSADLIHKFSANKNILNVNELIEGMVFPAIKREISTWQCLKAPTYHLNTFMNWRKILNSIDTKLFEILLWEVWMPKTRNEIMAVQSMKHCDELIHFVECWKPLLPEWMFKNIIMQFVVPKLEAEVENWNPLIDPIPIHSWIHPWLPLIEDATALENVYLSIRHKFSSALANWHPSDLSAKVILEPWKSVFSPPVWDAFLRSTVVPKLESAMKAFVVNPHNQQGIEAWSWVMAWNDMLSTNVISHILETFFFPKWIQALYQWLSHSPNYDEVANWYLGWKSMLSPPLTNHHVIKDFLRKSLEMMDYAVSSPTGQFDYRPTVSTNAPPQTSEQTKFRQEVLNSALSGTTSNVSFKQLVTRQADEHGILFMPLQNKSYEGKQVYQFGKQKMYMDRGVIFVHNISKNTWHPVSLQSLVDIA